MRDAIFGGTMARTAHEQRIWLSPICSRGCRAPGLSRRPLLPSGAQTCTSRIKMLGFKPLRRVNDRPQLYGKQKDHRHAPLPCYSPTAAPHFGAPFSGALADARPLRPPPHQHTRSPVRARRRMAARMQLLAPLFLRRVHRNTPPRSAWIACQRPAPACAHPISNPLASVESAGVIRSHTRFV